MPNDAKKLLANHALPIMKQVTAARLKRAGVTLGKDLGLQSKKSDRKDRISSSFAKRLAGG
jgi:hypothetical protein